jgi:putative transposase
MKRDPKSPAERSRKRKAKELARYKATHPSVNRGWLYRIVTTPESESGMLRMANLDRALWNLIHQWWQMSNRPLRKVTKSDLHAVVTQGRKDLPWLAELPTQAANAVEKRYWTTWERCWSDIGSAPSFHGRNRVRPSFDIPQARDLNFARINQKHATVQVPKVGKVTVRYHRPIPVGSRVTGARVTHDAGRWTLALRVEIPKPALRSPVESRPDVGFDRGVTIPLAGSDGTTFDHPAWLSPGEQRHLLCLERQSARQRHARWARSGGQGRGAIGANERRTYEAIAQIRARAARRRRDWQHHTSRTIANTYRVAAFENLSIDAMTRSAQGTVDAPGKNVRQKSGLNRSILNEGWGTLFDLTSYKLIDNGGGTVTVPAAGTSTQCHVCGSTAKGQRKNQALFVCGNPDCGWSGNADFNAARNIINRAVSRGLVPTPSSGIVDAACLGYAPGKRPELQLPVGTEATLTSDGPRKQEKESGQRAVAA